MGELGQVTIEGMLAYTVPAVCSMIGTIVVAFITRGTRRKTDETNRKLFEEIEPRVEEIHKQTVNGESGIRA